MLGEICTMQITMTRKNCKKYLHSTISFKYKIVLWKFFYAGSQIRAVQIHAMRNRATVNQETSEKSAEISILWLPEKTTTM